MGDGRTTTESYWVHYWTGIDGKQHKERLNKLPAIGGRSGHWIPTAEHNGNLKVYKCSRCGLGITISNYRKEAHQYCGRCGARNIKRDMTLVPRA